MLHWPNFMEQKCVIDKQQMIQTSVLYTAYMDYLKENSIHSCPSMKTFTSTIYDDPRFRQRRTSICSNIVGINLKDISTIKHFDQSRIKRNLRARERTAQRNEKAKQSSIEPIEIKEEVRNDTAASSIRVEPHNKEQLIIHSTRQELVDLLGDLTTIINYENSRAEAYLRNRHAIGAISPEARTDEYNDLMLRKIPGFNFAKRDLASYCALRDWLVEDIRQSELVSSHLHNRERKYNLILRVHSERYLLNMLKFQLADLEEQSKQIVT